MMLGGFFTGLGPLGLRLAKGVFATTAAAIDNTRREITEMFMVSIYSDKVSVNVRTKMRG
jgi:hypothetical protein